MDGVVTHRFVEIMTAHRLMKVITFNSLPSIFATVSVSSVVAYQCTAPHTAVPAIWIFVNTEDELTPY